MTKFIQKQISMSFKDKKIKYLLLLSAFFSLVTMTKGQSTFAPIGAKWKYYWNVPGGATPEIHSVKDTMVQGQH